MSVLIDFFVCVFNALKTSQGFAEMNVESPLVSTNLIDIINDSPLCFQGNLLV